MFEPNEPPKHLNDTFESLFSSGSFAASSSSVSPEGAQLDNRGRALTPHDNGDAKRPLLLKRRQAWSLRDTASMILRPADIDKRGPAVCGCGRAGYQTEEVAFHLNENGVAKTSGVLHCDSSWLCPVCAPRRGKERQERVEEVFDYVKAYSDGEMIMCTLTVRHRRDQSLDDLKKAVQTASRLARQGAPWSRAKKKYGVMGVISAPEVTWSPDAGWHFHIHTAFVMRTTPENAEELGHWFVRRYMDYIHELGFTALIDAQDVSLINNHKNLAKYIGKGVSKTRDLAWEMAGQATKKARSKGGLHPFDILEQASGSDAMKELFREYAGAMKGVRSCVITKALADKLGIEPDADGEKEGETQVEPDVLGTLPTFVWNKVMNRMKGSVVLSILEDGGACAWNDARAAAYSFADFDLERKSDDFFDLKKIPRLHEPTAETLANEVSGRCFMKKNKGQVIGEVIDQHRDFAKSRGLTFVLPPIKQVLDLLAA